MNNRPVSRRTLLKYSLGALGAAAITPLLDACGSSAAASGPKVTLKMSSSLTTGPNSAHWAWYNKFQQLLDQRTNKRLTINYFPNNQLGQEADVIKLVQLGTVDMMISGSSIWSNIVPEIGVLDMGYLFQSLDGAGKALDGPGGGQLAQLLYNKTQVKILGWSYSFGFRNVCTKKPVLQPSDLAGMKIRVLQSANFVQTLKLMGAVPTPLPLGEIYTSLQTGVIDGLEHDFPTILSNSYYEIAKNIALTEHIFNPNITTINQQAFNRIPADLQATFVQAATDATTYQRTQASGTSDADKTALQQKGVTISPIDKTQFKANMQPLWTSFTAQYPQAQPVLQGILSVQS